MKKSKFTEAQIVFALMQSETGVRVPELCRKMGISDATFYNRMKKYGGFGVTELRELRQLKEENARLKQMVADLSLDRQMLQDVIEKSANNAAKAGVKPFFGWTTIGFLSAERVGSCRLVIRGIIMPTTGEVIRPYGVPGDRIDPGSCFDKDSYY